MGRTELNRCCELLIRHFGSPSRKFSKGFRKCCASGLRALREWETCRDFRKYRIEKAPRVLRRATKSFKFRPPSPAGFRTSSRFATAELFSSNNVKDCIRDVLNLFRSDARK